MKNLLFTFEDLKSGNKSLKKLADAFTKAGPEVISQDVDPKVKRTAGITYREASLTFADSQKVTLAIKQTGDVYQVKVNGAVLPLKNPDDHAKAIAEVVKALDAGRAKFQAKQARVKVTLPEGTKSKVSDTAEKGKSRLQELDEQIAKATKERDGLKAELDGGAGHSIKYGDDVRNIKLNKAGVVRSVTGNTLSVRTAAGDVEWQASDVELMPSDEFFDSVAILDSASQAKKQVEFFARHHGLKLSKSGGVISLSKNEWMEVFDDYAEAYEFLKKARDDHDYEGKKWVFDSVATPNADLLCVKILDGLELPPDQLGGAVNTLMVALDTVENNEPINRAAGNVAMADLELKEAASFRKAITILTDKAAVAGDCALLDSVKYSVKVEFAEPGARPQHGPEVAAYIDWAGRKYGIGASLMPATAADRKEFGPGTFRFAKGDTQAESIVKIDPKGMKIHFIDNEHYEATEEVKWGDSAKLNKLVIYNKGNFEAAYSGA